jgi:predicted XRE-type DNA-binding protein
MALKITHSSGNVFRDLGFGPEEARHLRLRSDLMIAVCAEIERRKLTQSDAAELFGVSQPRISDLVRGKLHLFSAESLVGMLDRAGIQVGLTLYSGVGLPADLAVDVEMAAAVADCADLASVAETGAVETARTTEPGAVNWIQLLMTPIQMISVQTA